MGDPAKRLATYAEKARTSMAAARYLRKMGIPRLTQGEADALEAQIAREIANASPRRRGGRRKERASDMPDTVLKETAKTKPRSP